MLETAIRAARAAGQILIEELSKAQVIRSKGFRNIVTEVDYKAEAAILEILHAAYPNHAILSEEAGANEGKRRSRYLWIVDPLDGTTNYAHHYPVFSVSIGLYHDDEPLLGVVYEPNQRLLFHAERNKGAHLNGRPIHVNTSPDLTQAIGGFSVPYEPPARELLVKLMGLVLPHIVTVRSIGSAALSLCLVAAGWIDFYIQPSLHPWDAAAGALIVREAGGTVTNFAGECWHLTDATLLASNGLLHDQVRKFVSLSWHES